MTKRLLMIDNYDSFTYNLVQYYGQLGLDVLTYRNDEIDIATIEQLAPNLICLSPGPGTPDDAGITLAVIDHFAGRIPLFGVCLGLQGIGQHYGGRIVHAQRIMHGKTSKIYHNNTGVFTGLPNPFNATRYHSLVVAAPASDELELTAWTQTETGDVEEIMGLRHKQLAVEGVQFHPESILSEHGLTLMQQFIEAHS